MTAPSNRPTIDAGRFPASPAQPGLWFASVHGADPTAYNQPLLLPLRVPLDHSVLVEALRAVHRAHSALRTTFEMNADGDLSQLVHSWLEPIVDERDHAGPDPDGWVAEQVAEVAGTKFDLLAGPLVHVRHLRLTAQGRSVLVFNIHHTVFDGMSFKPYLSQLEAAYTELAAGREPDMRARRQAIDSYARWSERCTNAEAPDHWRGRLTDAPAPPPIGLPGEGPARHLTRQLALDEGLSARVAEFCRTEAITTSMFFVALGFVLLHRQTRQDDILLGIPVTVRDTGDAEVIGHLTNTVVLRHRLTADASARDVLRAVKREILEALRHRHTPLEAVVAELRASGADLGGAGDLFNAMITVMPSGSRRLDLREWGADTWEHVPGGAKYDLAILVDETPDHYTLVVEHTTAADDGESFTGYLAQRLRTLVESVLDDPDTRVHDLRWTSDEEERAIAGFCARRADAPELGTELTADRFTASAQATPADPAIVADGVTTDYAELARRAEAVAADLADRGVRDGAPVAVLMRPSAELVVTILGILRAGGSYVVLDADHPAERLRFVLHDCGARILVRTAGTAMAGVEPPEGLEVVDLSRIGRAGTPPERDRKTPLDTAYIVYTSGSTGRPKGVELPEATLANLVRNQHILSSGRRMNTLQYMPPAFDVFTLEVFGTLCSSGTLVIPPACARTDFEQLAALMAEQRIERAYFPYVALRELAAVLRSSGACLPDLREVYVTGERLVVTDDLREMFRRNPKARLINAYGPSEAHLCSEDRLPADPDTWPALPSIGRVVAGVDAYVLSDAESAQRAPFGVDGELCVAGPVVSPGYIGLPEKTSRAMVPDPFVPGQLMYRTGDIVALAADGRLHYHGREDDQVKIRGYRVEPSEVEAALERELDVDAAAVIVVPAGGDRVLHAFMQSGAPLPPDWRARLGAVLPGYMIPRTVTRIDTFPLTPNGKTDRRALEALLNAEARPDSADEGADGTSAEWTDAERAMAEMWAQVLGHRPATPDVDFFEQGGHSLLAVRLHRLTKERLGSDIALSALLSTPTVRGMARSLGGDRDDGLPDLRQEAQLRDLSVGERSEPADATVLLTGATGFLGSHLLDELQRTGHRVACLLRADSVEEGRERLRAAFRKFALDASRIDEVEICPGDLSRPRLGLGEEYEAWARGVSEVYHAAAHINFVAPYHTVKHTNVDGMRRLLEFCGINRTPLRVISTLGVFPPDSTAGPVGERSVPGDPASLGIGYSQSKWVAEHLALRAREFGLPVTVHRIGRIGGHSRTGACRHDDFFWLQLKGFAALGRYPEDIAETPAVDLLPVDYVARAIVRLSEAEADNENWHLFHPRGLTWREIIQTIRAEGYPVRPTSHAEWMAALERQVESGDQQRGLGPLVPLMREGMMRLGDLSFDNERSVRALADLGCPIPAADTRWLRRMFAYFRAVGAVGADGVDGVDGAVPEAGRVPFRSTVPEPGERSVVIVGAGPVGCALATLLRRQGVQVDVFEREEEDEAVEPGSGNSFNLTLTSRGLDCLPRSAKRRLYLQGLVLDKRIIHHRDGAISTQPYGTADSHHLLSIPRRILQDILRDHALRAGVRIHYGQLCVDVDTARPAALMQDRVGSTAWVPTDLVVGCDGANSAVREAIAQAHPDDMWVSRDTIDHGFAEITMEYRDADPTGMHLWPRGDHFLQAQPNRDRTFTTSLFKPLAHDAPQRQFSGLSSPGAIRAYCATEFPDVFDRMSEVGQELMTRTPGRLRIISCAPYHHGRAVLVGDAAHTVVPFFGQGINCSFEDAATLSGLLERARFAARDGSAAVVAEVAEEYSRSRVSAGHALAELSLRNLQELSAHVADSSFLQHRALERRLHELHPELYTPLYQLVAFTSTPYDAAQRTYRELSSALHSLCEGRDPRGDQDAIITEFVEKYGDGLMPDRERTG
ncbi:amino acid adenylation domain-containing protein [Streptomyces sp. CA-250714]|uniref:amino acid adenylation domain-containing protein n=1 Tax=Streptomyces sp. CA-250714 TaxID=3240060 RepID=UPI003D9083BE